MPLPPERVILQKSRLTISTIQPKLSDSQFDELFKAAEEELVTKEEIERTEEADIDTR